MFASQEFHVKSRIFIYVFIVQYTYISSIRIAAIMIVSHLKY